MDVDDLYLAHRETIEKVIDLVCRRNRMGSTDAEEFAGTVRLKLIDSDYAILRKFQSRSSLRTFLVAVVQRLYLDYRNGMWGKWRPSAEARRMGGTAMLLERLIHRDGMSFDEAAQVLESNHQLRLAPGEVETIRRRLPPRVPRVFVSEEALDGLPASDPGGESAMLRQEGEVAGRSVCEALESALRSLEPEDRLLVTLHFYEGLTIARIARMQQVEQKPLYQRLGKALARLRGSLLSQGFEQGQVAEVLQEGL